MWLFLHNVAHLHRISMWLCVIRAVTTIWSWHLVQVLYT